MRHRHGLRKLNRTSRHRLAMLRNGGYLRILKHGFRKGDNAPMAYVELLDRPEPSAEGESAGKEKAEAKAA